MWIPPSFRSVLAICFLILPVGGSSVLWIGCAGSSLELKPVSHEERLRKNTELGFGLAQQFEARLKFKRETEVSIYLRELAQVLVDHSPDLKGTTVGVWLVKDFGQEWKNYSLPGGRIYISGGMLQTLNYENEVAALIAMELGHIKNSHVLKRLGTQVGIFDQIEEKKSSLDGILSNLTRRHLKDVDFFGPLGIFTFSAEEQVMAVKNAVSILYLSGFDPRGVVSALDLLKKNPKKSSCDPITLGQLIDAARREVAYFAPLRNPIMRSAKFRSIQKRIRKL